MSADPTRPPAPDAGSDPSMEDILASIRRILNEEEAQPQPAPEVLELTPAMRAEPPAAAAPGGEIAAPPTASPPAPSPLAAWSLAALSPAALPPAAPPLDAPESLLHASPRLLAEPAPEPAEPPPAPAPVAVQPPVALAAAPEHPAPRGQEPAPPAAEPPALVAPAAAAAAAASVGELVRRLASTQQAAVSRGGPTIEDIVRDEIRGLLKAWLDENLPRVVERLVRAEIERVVSRHVG